MHNSDRMTMQRMTGMDVLPAALMRTYGRVDKSRRAASITGPMTPDLLAMVVELSGVTTDVEEAQPSRWEYVRVGTPVVILDGGGECAGVFAGMGARTGDLEVDRFGNKSLRLPIAERNVRLVNETFEGASKVPSDAPEDDGPEFAPVSDETAFENASAMPQWDKLAVGARVEAMEDNGNLVFGEFVRKPGGKHEALVYVKVDGDDKSYRKFEATNVFLAEGVLV